MRVAVIGGRLQGVEATYLAHKAGWEVILVDKDPFPPARGLCDAFIQVDVAEGNEFIRELREVQLIIPALEDEGVLSALSRWATMEALSLAFDPGAYAVSSSKIRSDQLFADIGIPVPLPWPKASFPLIVKPSDASGSKDVRRIDSAEAFQYWSISSKERKDWVIQEFLEGPSFSIEVLGFGQGYQTLQVTDLEMDSDYDCKRVRAPSILSEDKIGQFEELTLTISRALNVRGIMDVEVILHDGKLKVLEIDARLPSQTPTAVYLSSGINMVEMLGTVFWKGQRPVVPPVSSQRGVVYEHLKVSPGRMEIGGEHMMASAGPLHLVPGFFGSDEAITNYALGASEWVATVIHAGKTFEEAWDKRCRTIEKIREHFSLLEYLDPSPSIPSIRSK